MKVILLDDVPRLGHEGDVVEVADGYLRNYLEPRKLAVPAKEGAVKDLENRQQAIARREDQKRAAAQELVEGVRERKIVVRAQTGEGTKLHGSVTAQQIAEAAAAELGLEVDRRDIDIPEPIREIGDYLVTATIYKDVATQLAVSVVPMDAEETRTIEEAVAEVEAEERAEAEQEEADEGEDEEEDGEEEST
jgi:large subunit ribosomal protein L9